MFVLDLDGREGEEWLTQFEVPSTLTVVTGRGRHLYFLGEAPTRTKVADQVDIRGTNAFVVAPPSVHASGATYRWLDPTAELADAPAALLEALAQPWLGDPEGDGPDGGHWLQGERNQKLYSLGTAMRSQGLREGEIRAALEVANAERCLPPIEDAEVTAIARSAAKGELRRAEAAALLNLGLRDGAYKVHLALLAHLGGDGTAFPSAATLAERTGLSERTVWRCLKELVAAGVYECQNRRTASGIPTSNLYTLQDQTQWRLAGERQPPETLKR